MPEYAYEVYTKKDGILVPLQVLDPPYTATDSTPYVPPAKVTGVAVTEALL